MRDEDIIQIGRVSAGFGIEVGSSALHAATLKNHQHSLCQFINVDRELIGVPSVLIITPVGINGTQHTGIHRTLQIVLESVSCQGSMVHLNVQLEILVEVVGTKESNHSLSIYV